MWTTSAWSLQVRIQISREDTSQKLQTTSKQCICSSYLVHYAQESVNSYPPSRTSTKIIYCNFEKSVEQFFFFFIYFCCHIYDWETHPFFLSWCTMCQTESDGKFKNYMVIVKMGLEGQSPIAYTYSVDNCHFPFLLRKFSITSCWKQELQGNLANGGADSNVKKHKRSYPTLIHSKLKTFGLSYT